eukprot:7358561-Lingulodinium_polyedra.AAC.1
MEGRELSEALRQARQIAAASAARDSGPTSGCVFPPGNKAALSQPTGFSSAVIQARFRTFPSKL